MLQLHLEGAKCPKWHNCYFLHVDPKALRKQFKRFRCMCGPNSGICAYGKYDTCLYAHRPEELTVVEELEESGYPDNEDIRDLRAKNDAGTDMLLQIPQKFIANTEARTAPVLCLAAVYEWCNRRDCRQGVHLTSAGWTWLWTNYEGEKPPRPPAYFAKKVKASLPKRPLPKASVWDIGRPEPKAPRQTWSGRDGGAGGTRQGLRSLSTQKSRRRRRALKKDFA